MSEELTVGHFRKMFAGLPDSAPVGLLYTHGPNNVSEDLTAKLTGVSRPDWGGRVLVEIEVDELDYFEDDEDAYEELI